MPALKREIIDLFFWRKKTYKQHVSNALTLTSIPLLTLADLLCTSVVPQESFIWPSFDRGSWGLTQHTRTPWSCQEVKRNSVTFSGLLPTLPHCMNLLVCEGEFEWTILPLKNQVTVRTGMPAIFTIRLTCSPSKHAVPTTSQYCPYSTKAVDKWVLGGAEAPPNFWHLYVKINKLCTES